MPSYAELGQNSAKWPSYKASAARFSQLTASILAECWYGSMPQGLSLHLPIFFQDGKVCLCF